MPPVIPSGAVIAEPFRLSKSWTLLSRVAVLGIAPVLLLTAVHAPGALAKNSTRVPAPAFPFVLPTANGRVDFDSLRGNVVLVDFWASWCGPCRQSFPWMTSMHDKYAGKGLVIVAVNLDKDRAAAAKFLDAFRVPFTVAYDPAGKTAEGYQVKAMPTCVVVSRTGQILHTHAGFDARKTGALEAVLEEACSK
jgi:thiol-disulfide isomerase/thioredoxin